MAGKIRSKTITMLSFHGTVSVVCHEKGALSPVGWRYKSVALLHSIECDGFKVGAAE